MELRKFAHLADTHYGEVEHTKPCAKIVIRLTMEKARSAVELTVQLIPIHTNPLAGSCILLKPPQKPLQINFTAVEFSGAASCAAPHISDNLCAETYSEHSIKSKKTHRTFVYPSLPFLAICL